ncbi:MAG: DMT family transporter, partial [Planctomycetota bacterium]|nr:DMT family transporter [Planctomycetota bacterium]
MKKVLGLTASVVLLWSLSPVFIRPAVRGGVPPLALTIYGTAAAFGFLAAVTLARGRMRAAVALARRNGGLLLAMAISGWIVYPLLFYPAYRYMPASQAFLINYLHPIFTMLLGRPAAVGVMRRIFRVKEADDGARPAPSLASLAFPVALCFGGVAVIALAGGEGAGAEGSFADRVLWSFLLAVAAVSWGLYSNLRRNLRGPGGEAISGADDLATLWAAGLAAAMLLAIPAAAGGAGPVPGGGSFADAIRRDFGDRSVAWDSP